MFVGCQMPKVSKPLLFTGLHKRWWLVWKLVLDSNQQKQNFRKTTPTAGLPDMLPRSPKEFPLKTSTSTTSMVFTCRSKHLLPKFANINQSAITRCQAKMVVKFKVFGCYLGNFPGWLHSSWKVTQPEALRWHWLRGSWETLPLWCGSATQWGGKPGMILILRGVRSSTWGTCLLVSMTLMKIVDILFNLFDDLILEQFLMTSYRWSMSLYISSLRTSLIHVRCKRSPRPLLRIIAPGWCSGGRKRGTRTTEDGTPSQWRDLSRLCASTAVRASVPYSTCLWQNDKPFDRLTIRTISHECNPFIPVQHL